MARPNRRQAQKAKSSPPDTQKKRCYNNDDDLPRHLTKKRARRPDKETENAKNAENKARRARETVYTTWKQRITNASRFSLYCAFPETSDEREAHEAELRRQDKAHCVFIHNAIVK